MFLRIAIPIRGYLSILYALITTRWLVAWFSEERSELDGSHLHRVHSTDIVDLNADSPGSFCSLSKGLPIDIVR